MGLVRGFSIKEEGVSIPILQYADDTLLLMDADVESSNKVITLLWWFEAALGLHVNLAKTRLFKINEVSCWDQLLLDWVCEEGSLPDKYLGLPLASKFKHRAVWQDIIEKFKSYLAQWKRRYLTKAGGLVLIKSTLSTLPIFMLSLLVLPASVEEELERIMTNFLWGSAEEKKKYHLLDWEKVCIPTKWGDSK